MHMMTTALDMNPALPSPMYGQKARCGVVSLVHVLKKKTLTSSISFEDKWKSFAEVTSAKFFQVGNFLSWLPGGFLEGGGRFEEAS